MTITGTDLDGGHRGHLRRHRRPPVHRGQRRHLDRVTTPAAGRRGGRHRDHPRWHLHRRPRRRLHLRGPAPTVTGIDPDHRARPPGGTTVTITGTDLTGPPAVTFGGHRGHLVHRVNTTTSITVTTPAALAGTVDVTVTTPGAPPRRPADLSPTCAAPTSHLDRPDRGHHARWHHRDHHRHRPAGPPASPSAAPRPPSFTESPTPDHGHHPGRLGRDGGRDRDHPRWHRHRRPADVFTYVRRPRRSPRSTPTAGHHRRRHHGDHHRHRPRRGHRRSPSAPPRPPSFTGQLRPPRSPSPPRPHWPGRWT